MTSLFITMSITISFMFMFLKHPLSMGFMLIMQTIMISMITGQLINNFWFSYILLITMLSGALVLFIYMASVASNEKFYSSMKMIALAIMLLSSTSLWMFTKNKMNNSTYKTETLTIDNDQVMSLIKLFNMNNMMITIMIISYLFLTMIVISYIVNVFEGPLRMKN